MSLQKVWRTFSRNIQRLWQWHKFDLGTTTSLEANQLPRATSCKADEIRGTSDALMIRRRRVHHMKHTKLRLATHRSMGFQISSFRYLVHYHVLVGGFPTPESGVRTSVPGGPKRRTPEAGVMPMRRNVSGYRAGHTTISRTACLARSRPPTLSIRRKRPDQERNGRNSSSGYCGKRDVHVTF